MVAAKRILVIDDEPDIRAVSELSLGKVGGWDVLVADSGEAGLELAERERPDAILLDSMMPGLDGAATIQRLKAAKATRDIPVLFLTAKLQRADRERYHELGAEGVLAKPFDPMQLPDELARALGWER
jgi:two-component system, OmpR family, alkaline phosphatase synthesis response regulator PhoP